MKNSYKVLSVGLAILVIFIVAILVDLGMNKQTDVPDPVVTDQVEIEEGVIDLRLPSESADGGTLTVRLYVPENPRYDEGTPVVVWVPGGYETKGINHDFPPTADDIMVATFIFPGATDEWSGFGSDGTYDWRGENCIRALADVILFAAGQLEDENGNTIDDLSPVPVIHNNIGTIGVSNGGNLPVAAAALHGDELSDGALVFLLLVGIRAANPEVARNQAEQADGHGWTSCRAAGTCQCWRARSACRSAAWFASSSRAA